MTLNSRNHADQSSSAGTATANGDLPAALIGINEGSLLQGKPTDWSRDLFLNSEWRGAGYGYDDGRMQLDANGYPHSYMGAETSLLLQLPVVRSAARAGVYVVTYPAAMTCALQGTLGGATVVQPFVGGVGKIRLPATNNGALGIPTLRLSGPIPAGGVAMSIVKESDWYNPEATQALRTLGKINRSMTARAVNGDRLYADNSPVANPTAFPTLRNAAARYKGPTPNGPLCVEAQVDACNQAGQHMWHNQSHIDDDSVVAAEAAYVAANLAADARVFIELSNELWNFSFRQARESMLFGQRLGMGVAAATPGTLVPETIIFNDPGGKANTANSNTTLYACAIGDMIFMSVNGVGYQVYQALTANPAGTVITPITTEGANTADGKWKLIHGATSSILAGKRWIAKRSKEIWAIWDAAFATAGRQPPLHVVGAQAGGSGFTAIARDIFEWDNCWQAIDRLAIAPYWGGGVGAPPNTLYNYAINYPSPTYPHPWTATEKALVTTNIPAFLDAFFAVAGDTVDSALAQASAIKTQMATYLAGKGDTAGRVKLSSYECNHHVNFNIGGWPADHQAPLVTAHKSILTDARFFTLTARYLNGLTALGGEHCVFDRVGPMPTTYGTLSYWGLQEHDLDYSGRYNAVAGVNAVTG